MWGAIIGAVTSVAGGIASAIGANKARKIQEEELKKREERQAATYARRANQDYTQRADAQRMLQMTREALQKRAEAAAGRQAVMGLTDSGLAAEREMAENVMADTASQIAAAGEAQKDEAEKIYEQQQDANSQERANIAANRAVATGQAVAQMTEGVGKAAGALTETFAKTPKAPKAATPSIPDVSKAMAPRINAPTTEAKNLMQQWDKDIKVSLGKNVPGYHKV